MNTRTRSQLATGTASAQTGTASLHPGTADSAASPDGRRAGQRDREIPFCRTVITNAAQQAALRVMAGGWVTMGRESAAFEQEFGDWVGASHAIAVSSCTAAIQLALTALDLPAGSPVLTPTLTFCGAVHAILHARLRPVLVDADELTLAVSPEAVEAAAARSGAKAMVVQHMAGYPLDSSQLAAAAGIPERNIVEDAAHGLGGSIDGRPVGSNAAAACFSFYATKNLPIGEGGAITSTDAELADRLRRMRLHGMSGDAWRRYHRSGSWQYTVEESGLKANFTDIQAAIGREQLKSLDGWQHRRAEIASRYDSLLAVLPGIVPPPRPPGGRHAWHLYIVRIKPWFGLHRDVVAERLARAGVGTSVHFIPVHHFPYFRRMLGAEECDRMSAADAIFPELLSLPLYPGLSDADIDRVCTVLADLPAK